MLVSPELPGGDLKPRPIKPDPAPLGVDSATDDLLSSGLDAIELDDGKRAGSGSARDATPADLQAWPGMMADIVNVRRHSPALTCHCHRPMPLKLGVLPSDQQPQTSTSGSNLA